MASAFYSIRNLINSAFLIVSALASPCTLAASVQVQVVGKENLFSMPVPPGEIADSYSLQSTTNGEFLSHAEDFSSTDVHGAQSSTRVASSSLVSFGPQGLAIKFSASAEATTESIFNYQSTAQFVAFFEDTVTVLGGTLGTQGTLVLRLEIDGSYSMSSGFGTEAFVLFNNHDAFGSGPPNVESGMVFDEMSGGSNLTFSKTVDLHYRFIFGDRGTLRLGLQGGIIQNVACNGCLEGIASRQGSLDFSHTVTLLDATILDEAGDRIANGQVVSSGLGTPFTYPLSAAPVPLPGAFGPVIVALGSMGFLRRRAKAPFARQGVG